MRTSIPRRLRRTLLYLGILSIVAGEARAQLAQPSPADPVRTVITVTARPTQVEASAADITVVAPDETPAANPYSLGDLLRFQPGLYVGQTGGRGGLTSVSLRGGDTNFTLFLIDGIPVNDITDQLGGSVDVSTILPVQVGRVEVARGPLSALYGSDAAAGVINIVTRTPSDSHWSVGASGGSFGAFSGDLAGAGTKGRLAYTLGIAGTRIGPQVERDSYDAVDASARATVAAGRSALLAFTFRVRHSDATGFPANSGGPVYALNRELESRTSGSLLGSVEWKRTTARWSHTVEADAFHQNQDQNTPTIYDRIPASYQTVPATTADTDFRRVRLNGSSSLEVLPGWTLTGGAGYRDENGENIGAIRGYGPANYALDRHTAALFSETILERKRWSLVAGIRSDWVTGTAQRSSPRLGGSLALPWRGARARASWGRGFKMPSFYALAQPFIGNPRLRPETSESADIGLDQSLGRRFGELHVNAFRSVYGDLVDFSPQLFRLVNRSEALARGLDLAWQLRLPRAATLLVHGTYSSVYLKGTAEALRDRPRWRTGSLLSAPLGTRSHVFLETLWVSSRFDYQLPVLQLDRAPSYFVANLGVDRRFTDALTCFLRVENLTNHRYQGYVGFPDPGIAARVGFQYVIR